MDDVEYPGDAGFVDPAEAQRAGQNLLQHLRGKGPVGVDERQRHLAVQRGVQRLPELQRRRAAVEHQQPVTSAGDTGARNQVVGGQIAVRLVRCARLRIRTRLGVGRNVGLEVVGGRPGQLGARCGALPWAVCHLRSFR